MKHIKKMYNNVKYIVDNNARQYEHNTEELDTAREQAENESNNYDELAPGTEQTRGRHRRRCNTIRTVCSF